MPISFQSTLSRNSNYRPEIDGLRGVAVLSVVLFHAGVAGFSGGFVGVDIFFVISGYLITSILIKDIEKDKFSLLTFYDRRVRRIFPALFSVLLSSIAAATIILTPPDLLSFGKSLVASSLFVSNVYFSRAGGPVGYFGGSSQRAALLHTWSLSVEEQFYLLFPLMLLLLVRWTKNRTILPISVLAACSFITNIWMTSHVPTSAFYSIQPRAWELLLGSLLALKAVPQPRKRWLREIAGLSGLALMAWAVLGYSRDTPFPGIAATVPCMGAWLTIYAGEQGDSAGKRILSFRPLVIVGVISYSLYLWHWPIFVFTNYFLADSGGFTGIETVGVILLSLVLAAFSYEFVERPFRGVDSKVSRRQIFAIGLSASVVSVLMGFAFFRFQGLPERYDGRTRQLIVENSQRKEDFLDVCGNWKADVRSFSNINSCATAATSAKKIMFWGDSHVQQLYPLVMKMYDSGDLQGRSPLFAIENGCIISRHMNNARKGYHCDTFASLAVSRAEEADIDTVFIAFSTWWSQDKGDVCLSTNGKCTSEGSIEEARSNFLQGLFDEVNELRMRGKRVIVSLPFPIYDKSIPDLEIRNAVFGRFGLAGTPDDISEPVFREQIATTARSAGAEIFDPRESLCSQQNCITQVNGVSIYKDDNHIAASQIGILEGSLRSALAGGPVLSWRTPR